MGSGDSELHILERLMPTENGLTVFDADTQETSYGIHFLGGIPHIFDSHRKAGHYVATLELLTEIVRPIRISEDRVARFCHDVRAHGLLPIPYTGCFFKENLHVYAFSGPVRGFDISAVGPDLPRSELRLHERVALIQRRIPTALKTAQRKLLEGRLEVRDVEDLRVLAEKFQSDRGP